MKTNVIEVSGFSIRVSKETLLIARFVGMGLGFLTESNKPFIRFGVTGPILKSTTEVTWAGLGRENTGPRMKLSQGALDSQHDTPVYYHYYLNDLIGLSHCDIAPSMIS